MQTPLRSGHIYMEDAQCAGTNEKSILQFLLFEIFKNLATKKLMTKIAQCSGTDFLVPDFFFVRFLVYEIWLTLSSIFVVSK